jgi:hypothetical protein
VRGLMADLRVEPVTRIERATCRLQDGCSAY